MMKRVRLVQAYEGRALKRLFVNLTVLQEVLISKRLRKVLTVTQTESQDYQ